MANKRVEKLLEARENLCNSFLCDKEKLMEVAKLRIQKQGVFHDYSYGNLVLACYDFYIRFGRMPERLASFKTWTSEPLNGKIKKGSKGMQILTPQNRYYAECPQCKEITYGLKRIKNGCKCGYEFQSDETQRYLSFGIGTVFDISQVENGYEILDEVGIESKSDFKFGNVRLHSKYPIRYTADYLRKGYTTKEGIIHISIWGSNEDKLEVLLHETLHQALLHFDRLESGEITRNQAEGEAQICTGLILGAMGIDGYLETADYVSSWYPDCEELLSAEELIDTAEKVMRDLKIS